MQIGFSDSRKPITVLWLDDVRDPEKYLSKKPDKNSGALYDNISFYNNFMQTYSPKFIWVKNFDEFTDYIEKNGLPDFVSFDHDLGKGLRKGAECAAWLKQFCKENGLTLPKFYAHSANRNGREAIHSILDNMINEDAYIKGLDAKSKKVNVSYNTGKKHGQSNFRKGDDVKTDKMETLDADTYPVPLKGGIVSYNITSIHGSAVMQYFKHYFDSQKATVDVTNRMGRVEQYEMEMKKAEFDDFLDRFIQKVGRVISFATKDLKEKNDKDGPREMCLYPVPSSSKFNETMANEMARKLSNISIINQSLFKKDLENLRKDNEFIAKNKDYYSQKIFVRGNDEDKRTGEGLIDDELSRMKAVKKAQSYVETLRHLGSELVSLWHAREQYIKRGTYMNRIVPLYVDYYNTYAKLLSASSYVTPSDGKNHSALLKGVARLIKYSKPKRVEIRSNDIWATVGPDLRGKRCINGLPFKKIDIGEWESVPFEIKKSCDPLRMGLLGYFSKNDEILKDEAEKIRDSVFVIFDDNISGGATLSDICYQVKQLGVKIVIPITFGKMGKKYTTGRGKIQIREPEKRGPGGERQFITDFEYQD